MHCRSKINCRSALQCKNVHPQYTAMQKMNCLKAQGTIIGCRLLLYCKNSQQQCTAVQKRTSIAHCSAKVYTCSTFQCSNMNCFRAYGTIIGHRVLLQGIDYCCSSKNDFLQCKNVLPQSTAVQKMYSRRALLLKICTALGHRVPLKDIGYCCSVKM